MARNAASPSYLFGALVTVAAGAVCVGAAVSAVLVSVRAMPEDFVRPSNRTEYRRSAADRDAEDAIRVQDRRNERLQELQEEAAHKSASVEEEDVSEREGRRAYFRAESWCLLNGYANSRRLARCINRMVETGIFENTADW